MEPLCDKMLVWASFAEKEMKRLGYKNVETLHGAVDYTSFYPLKNRNEIRKKFGIDDCFVIGFVFKNQLRKSVPNLLQGFKTFKEENPNVKAKLLLHTDWGEVGSGWDIPRYIKEMGIDFYYVAPYQGEDKNCPSCNKEKTFKTKSSIKGIGEKELNELYNCMDVYCHPFTSGGQELPIQEAKAAGLITLVTEYSCGTDSCYEDQGGIPLKWNEYREPGTQFIKASTSPHSISSKLERVFKMSDQKRSLLGKKAREFTIENYSIESSAKKLMSIIDSMPEINKSSIDKDKLKPDLSFKMPENATDEEFILKTYNNLLKVNLKRHSEVFEFLLKKIRSGTPREKIFSALKNNAERQLNSQEKKPTDLANFLDDSDKGKRLALVLPKSIGDIFMATSLLPDLKKTYPDYNIYYICQNEL